MEAELVLASSSTDEGISCWELRSGAEYTRFRSCSSPAHGLTSVALPGLNSDCIIASSQVLESKKSKGSIQYWSWNKPPPDVRSFPDEAIIALVSNSEGTYLVGGSISGKIYIWEVATGTLLKKWNAHHRAVTCLAFADNLVLVSGSEDGGVRVWSLFMIFDDELMEQANCSYEYSFSEHSLKVTDVVVGYGGCNAVIVSSSEDRTCKIWSMSRGRLLSSVKFPSIIDAVVLDPGEAVFYAGGRDGKIYVAALSAPEAPHHREHMIRSFSEHSWNRKAITCLKLSADGTLLITGSEDGMVRVWDTKTGNIVRGLRHSKGPVSNVLLISQPPHLNPRTSLTSEAASLRRHGLPALQKYSNSSKENGDVRIFLHCPSNDYVYGSYNHCQMMEKLIKELQQLGSSAANETELKFELKTSRQMIQQLKKMNEHLYQFCVSELMDGVEPESANGDLVR